MTKIFLMVTSFMTLLISSIAQVENPVQWKFWSKKISDRSFEVHLTARVDNPWHIYSQNSPKGGALPTSISFTKNPLISLDGIIKENGKLITKFEPVFGKDLKYYSEYVDFIQIITLKHPVKTNVSGSVEYMTCTDARCLPPMTRNFVVILN